MLQYLSDNVGNRTAVVIPIEEWDEMRIKYPDLDSAEGEIPQWQKDLLDKRLKKIAANPQSLRPIEELLDELDKDED